jgi:hypothetical protein
MRGPASLTAPSCWLGPSSRCPAASSADRPRSSVLPAQSSSCCGGHVRRNRVRRETALLSSEASPDAEMRARTGPSTPRHSWREAARVETAKQRQQDRDKTNYVVISSRETLVSLLNSWQQRTATLTGTQHDTLCLYSCAHEGLCVHILL